MTAIQVNGLGKTYVVPEREGGVRAALSALVRRRTRDVVAVSEVDFSVEPGEIVGFLGPNGAGKTTTLKMLAGLLHPTAGSAQVLGFTPWQRSPDYLGRMALIMGQRNQLQWDIPVLDSFRLNQAIFRIPGADFRTRLDELVDLLELGDLLRKPVRNLSLGERMKCEIAGSLLHYPAVLFLDEPTIGLDVAMQRRIRSFVAEYNARTGACVMLTSHYMADVEALCRRVIVIHQGRLLYDGDLTGLVERFAPHKIITVELEENAAVTSEEVTALLRATSVAGSRRADRGRLHRLRPAHPHSGGGRPAARGSPGGRSHHRGAADRAGDRGRLRATVRRREPSERSSWSRDLRGPTVTSTRTDLPIRVPRTDASRRARSPTTTAASSPPRWPSTWPIAVRWGSGSSPPSSSRWSSSWSGRRWRDPAPPAATPPASSSRTSW